MSVPAFQFWTDHSIMLVPVLHFLIDHSTMSVPAAHFQLAISFHHFTFTCISINGVGLLLREGGGDSAGPFDLIQYFYPPHGHFSQRIFRFMDILPYGHFTLWMFCPVDISPCRNFSPRTFHSCGQLTPQTTCSMDNSSHDNLPLAHFVPWTFRPTDILLSGLFCPNRAGQVRLGWLG